MKVSRKFHLSYAELFQRSHRVYHLLNRDLDHFTALGFPGDWPQQLRALTEEFKNFPTDVYWGGQQMLNTEARSWARFQLEGLIGEFRFRAKLALGGESESYRMFRFTPLGRLKEVELIRFGRDAVNTAKGSMDRLAERGVDQQLLDDISKAIQMFESAVEAQRSAIVLRDKKRVERVELANRLYTLIAEICEVGTRIWAGKDQVLHDEYMFYGSQYSAEAQASDQEVLAEEMM